jgi:hypothetical protein
LGSIVLKIFESLFKFVAFAPGAKNYSTEEYANKNP